MVERNGREGVSMSIMKCTACRREFEPDNTTKDMLAEAKALYPKEELDRGTIIVCDDCYFKFKLRERMIWTERLMDPSATEETEAAFFEYLRRNYADREVA
jgi:hypothetical protein